MPMKYLSKIWIRIVIAIILGFLWSAGSIDIAYPIGSPDAGCAVEQKNGVNTLTGNTSACRGIAYEDAISHPGDLISNKQNSLVRFITNIALVTAVSFAVISTPVLIQKKKS